MRRRTRCGQGLGAIASGREKGAVLVLVALSMVALLGLAALSVDIGHLAVVRNELQNAADAGALAGAMGLYTADGRSLRGDVANQEAFDAATRNVSERVAVDVHWSGGNTGDIQRGHWSFQTRTFTANASLLPPDLWDLTTEELDAETNFINAVRVVTRREDTPATSFFATIFGFDDFVSQAEAIAYIGFAGQLGPGEADQPIAICEESLKQDDGPYTCSIGRMINSGSNVESNETGGWTDFNQDNPCSGGTNAQAVRNLVCGAGNPGMLLLGASMATNGGEINSAFHDLMDCWVAETGRNRSWSMALPVVTCPGNNVGTCERLVGAVVVNVVWINDTVDPHYSDAPTHMEVIDSEGNSVTTWDMSYEPDGQVRWNNFADHFNLRNVDGSTAPYQQKAIYFQPDCAAQIPRGRTGGENFGILAKYPVLVR